LRDGGAQRLPVAHQAQGVRSMSRQLVITYYADRDMLGLVSDEDYEAFKDILLEQLHKEWPKAAVTIEDGEHAGVEVEIVDARVHEIANDVIEEREWATEDLETYDDYEEELEERRGADEDRDDY
jgi:hypothetical protein